METSYIKASAILLGCLLTIFAIPSAFAVDNLGIFQLDGNAVDGGFSPPDDWETLCDPDMVPGGTCQETGAGVGNSTNASVYTGLNADPAPVSIFDGGKKDIQDITQWSGKNGSVPDKNDITNAQAAAYICDNSTVGCDEGDLILYFEADRFSNVGDAFMGFWFFKDAVSFDSATGDFSGEHMPGDVLVLVNFPQSANGVPLVQAVEWDPSCSKAASNNPQVNDCAAKNLRLRAGVSGAGAVCDPSDFPGDQPLCAITNAEGGPNASPSTPSPWEYTSKDGFVNAFPYETFFEGGINLTEIIGGDSCFASFMAESRSSSSFTASLKDFVLDQFPLCRVEISKDCGEDGAYNPMTGNLEISYAVTVENTGVATVESVTATDDDCGIAGESTILNFGPLLAGQSDTKEGLCIIPEPVPEGAIVNGVSATAEASGGIPIVVEPAASCITDISAPGVCFDPCAFNTGPDLAATKNCVTALVAEDDAVKVKVNFSGTVMNTSDVARCQIVDSTPTTCVFPVDKACTTNADCEAKPVPLINVVASDDKAGTLTLLDGDMNPLATPVRLEPGETANFKGSYLPDGTGLGFSECPSNAQFMDTVTAGAQDAFTLDSVGPATASADCELCPPEGCPE